MVRPCGSGRVKMSDLGFDVKGLSTETAARVKDHEWWIEQMHAGNGTEFFANELGVDHRQAQKWLMTHLHVHDVAVKEHAEVHNLETEEVDDNETVECLECSERFSQLTWKHLKSHGLTSAEYKKKYPGAETRSPATIARKKDGARRANAHRVGVARSEEVKAKIRATRAANPAEAWNKGVARTEEQKRRQSETRKRMFATGELVHWNTGRATSEETKQKISETALSQERTYTEESKRKREETYDQKRSDGWVHHNTAAFKEKLRTSFNPDAEKLFNDREWLYEQHVTNKRTLASICVELGLHWYHQATTMQQQMKNFDIPVHRWTEHISAGQLELENFLTSLGVEFETNVRTIIAPYELDIYIPEFEIAIEYNGLFWHSEANGKDAGYHLMKTKMCEEKGVRLIHLMEDEWRDQTEQCKATLRHFFGKSERGVFARKTTIREIPWSVAKPFLDEHHLLFSGAAGSYRIGAYDGDELIGVMVFGTKTNEGSSPDEIELKRFVTNKKNNPGLGSKMFKHAIREKGYDRVVAFVDRRWFTGLVKDHIGFEVVGASEPVVWWTNGTTRRHRRFMTKEQLIERFGDTGQSKREMLREHGFVRIWDCGKIKLEWCAT